MSKANAKMPDCPKCGDNRRVYIDGSNYWCRRCNVGFDPCDDGDVGYGPPWRRLMREEARAVKQAATRNKRRTHGRKCN